MSLIPDLNQLVQVDGLAQHLHCVEVVLLIQQTGEMRVMDVKVLKPVFPTWLVSGCNRGFINLPQVKHSSQNDT
jgi:hypothetical protein